MVDLNKHRTKILNLAKNGKSVDEIAKTFKVSKDTMIGWFKAEMLADTHSSIPMSPFEIEKRKKRIFELRATGMTLAAIAAEIGLTEIGLSRWCKKYDITLPKRNP